MSTAPQSRAVGDADASASFRPSGLLRLLAYATPLIVLAILLAIYLVAPSFYLTYVLEYQHREYQAVEMATVTSALLASALSAYAAWRAWRERPALPPGATLHARFDRVFPTLLIGSVAAAALFLAGEEVSWGQTFRHWGVPENQKPIEYETNVHNNFDLPMQTLGQVYLCVVFFVVPAVWLVRRRLNLPGFWSVVVAEGPVIFCAAVAMGWKFVKELYLAMPGDHEQDRFYMGFVEQINEQKELLVAVALLMWAGYRVRKLRPGTGAGG